jgi:RimJ/RimL family protein N-acetyltransferase
LLSVTSDMPALLAESDLALTAGGTTTWEMAFMGLPAAVLSLACNQIEVAKAAAAAGTALDLGWHADVTPEGLVRALLALRDDHALRERMMRAGQRLIDGQGCDRVRQRLLGQRLRLRQARRDDAELLWSWANDPETRARGFHPTAIPWEDHVRWLEGKLQAPNTHLFLGVDENDDPVGQCRLDVSGPGEAVISISVGRERRGGGWGTELIAAATHWGQNHGLPRIRACIKPDNAASLRAFRKAGYEGFVPIAVQGQQAIHAVHEERAA